MISKKTNIQRDQFIAVALLTCWIYALFPPSQAYAGAMQNAICTIVQWIWGDLGTGLAVLGICAVSGAAMLGKASWGMAMTVAAGVAIMFGADSLANMLGVGLGVDGCPTDSN